MEIFRLYEEYRDNLARRDAFLGWFESTGTPGEIAAVRFPGIDAYYKLLSAGRGTCSSRRVSPRKPRYVVCSPGVLDEVLSGDVAGWQRFFSTDCVEMWEDVSDFSVHPESMSLRHGLSEDERRYLLGFVRSIARAHLSGDSPVSQGTSQDSPRRLSQASFAAVSLWCGGVLRGCMLAFENSCITSVQVACLRALKDSRFRPLEPGELEGVRFEVVLFSGLAMPLTERERREGTLYPEKAYRMFDGDRTAWFLPEVLNMGKTAGLEEHLERLGRKGGLSPCTAHTHYVETEDFVEDEQAAPLLLSGPAPTLTALDAQGANTLYERAARHLSHLLAESPLLPSAVNPFDIRSLSRISRGRGLFTMQALAEYARVMEDHSLLEKAARSYGAYTDLFGADESDRGQLLAAAYLGMAALDFGYADAARRYADIVEGHVPTLESSPQPIVCLQASRFLWRYGSVATAEQLLELVWDSFHSAQESGQPVSLAEYADLLVLVPALWGSCRSEYEEISTWYLTQQHKDGSFPNLTTGGLAYTRGTAKIFESLALDPERHAAALRSALRWLARMQYTKGSMFFVPSERRGLLEGGFRHDVQNPEAWPDAAGHVLVGATRLRHQALFL